MITKITHAELQSILKLKQKKYREESKLFLGEGLNFLLEISKKKEWIEKVLVTEEFYNSNIQYLKKYQPNLFFISAKDLEKVSETNQNQPILVVLKNVYTNQDLDLADKKRILYLFQLQDPGNAGTLIRTAAWFGWNAIVFSAGSVEWTNPKVIRASMGAFQNISISEDDSEFSVLKTISVKSEIILLDMSGIEIQNHKVKPNNPITVVVGNESNGFLNFPEQIHNTKKMTISGIPKNVESLNASVAGSIALYEFRNVE